MNTETELKRLQQGVKAIEMIEYHEDQLGEFEYDYKVRVVKNLYLVNHYKHMAQCEQRCIERLKKVYLRMGLSKNYGKH